MGLFSRGKSRGSSLEQVAARSDGPQMEIDRRAVVDHFTTFVEAHRGVEAYVEPATSVTTTTIVLIAWDGEWTRRAVGTHRDAFTLSQKLGVPAYDVNQTGYPNRMREWNSRQRKGGS